MIRKTLLLLFGLSLFVAAGCASDYARPSSYEYTPMYPYSQREMCGWGAVYCGPGP